MIKAQILFDKTDFEHSLLYFCRAARISPRNECARDGVTKCHKTIKNKLSRSSFQKENLARTLGELRTLGVESYLKKNEQIRHRGGEQLNDEYIKVISMEKDFLARTRKKCRIFGKSLPERKIISTLSETEFFLDRRLEFWSQA